MLRALTIILLIGGALMLLIAFLSGTASLVALLERHSSGGTGIMLADVEFFGLLALVCCTLGIFSLLVAKRIGRFLQKEGEKGKR